MFLSKKSSWSNLISEYVVYFFMATFPFINYSNSFLYYGTSTRSINLILLSSFLVVIFGIFLFRKNVSLIIPKSAILLSVSIYFLSVFTSALLSNDFQTAFYSNITRTTGIWYLLCLGIFLFLLLDILREDKKRKLIISIVVFSAALFSFLSMIGPEGFGLLFKNFKGDGFTLGNSTFAGMYIFCSFLLSLYIVFSEKKKSFWKIILPIILVLNPYIVNIGGSESKGFLSFLGEARASAIALFGSIFTLGIFFLISKLKNQKLKEKVSYGIFIFVIIGLVWGAFSLFSRDGLLRNFYLSQSTSARLLVWDISTKLIEEKPIFGWGIDNLEKVFELNYDSRSLEERYGNEPWFDRAHNIFIDQTFDNGIVGLIFYLLVYITTALSLLYVIFNSKKNTNKVLAVFLITYIGFHLVELQTAFDTSISYVLLAFILALSIVIVNETLEENDLKSKYIVPNYVKYTCAVVLIVFGLWSLFFKTFPFINSQIANREIRKVGSSEKRLKLYSSLFKTPIDLQAILRRTATDFQRGIGENPKVLEDSKKVEGLLNEIYVFEEEYTKYIETHPKHFRALLNYASIKIYYMLFGVNKLEEAQKILDQAKELVPTAPHPYWMKAVAYLYMQKFDLARKEAKAGLDLNSEVKTSQEIVKYIEDSIKTFPEIDLYFFKQI